ncbi:nitrite reductase [Paenibacillus sp. CMAA1739]|uniref:nitrite reductase n=1 Tax=Paenibacillus ottowii TaxID=2315729 RepID=UPI002731CEDD|nr:MULTISPECIES: nitrite reductase [Paenibacillus]MDP1513385.1 nitrite reductase [Paenibacillus ottowii]MEC4569371.1 nitrite reductase [Paenibacillus sp. CMAA1739]
MEKTIKIAISPPIQVGGSLFTPHQLVKIGDILGPNVKVEMTPFKQLYAEVPLEKRESIKEELERDGLEVNPAGFVTKSLIACNFCKGAEEAGFTTAKRLNQAIAGIETPTPLKIGYAGCALGTSEPLIKDIGVVKMRDKFDIYVGGESKGLKTSFAELLLSGVMEDQLIPAVTSIIDFYKAHAKGKEKFSKFVDRISLGQLKRIAVQK